MARGPSRRTQWDWNPQPLNACMSRGDPPLSYLLLLIVVVIPISRRCSLPYLNFQSPIVLWSLSVAMF